MTQRVLVTGGAGYIGTTLLPQLVTAGHLVRILDRFDFGAEALQQTMDELPAPRGMVDIQRGDLLDPSAVASALDGIDTVIHLAALVGFPACDRDPKEAQRTNVDGTRVLLRQLGGRPILYASTGSVYGKIGAICTEETPVNPLTIYGRTKYVAEQDVLEAGGMAFRIASLYGVAPRMRWDLLPHDFVRRALRQGQIDLFDGAARRTLLHITDAASAFLWALTHYQPGVFNLGDEANNRTKLEIAQSVQRQTACEITHATGHDPDARDYHVSYDKIHAAGWRGAQVWPAGLEAVVTAAVGIRQ